MSNVGSSQKIIAKGKLEKQLEMLNKMGYGMYFIRSNTTGNNMGIYITQEGYNLIQRLLGYNCFF